MSLQLPTAPTAYDTSNEAQTRRKLDAADGQNLKRMSDIVGSRLILRSPNGATWALMVDNAGLVTSSAVTL